MTPARAKAGDVQAWVQSAVTSVTEDCLVWPFRCQSKGYPVMRYEGKTKLAHRAVLTRTAGPPPSPRHEALHSCDVPLCCNPSHLRWGTHQQNMDEASARGRASAPRGEQHHKSRLTAEGVRTIRASAESTAELARRYGVSWNSLDAARRGVTWRYLDEVAS